MGLGGDVYVGFRNFMIFGYKSVVCVLGYCYCFWLVW